MILDFTVYEIFLVRIGPSTQLQKARPTNNLSQSVTVNFNKTSTKDQTGNFYSDMYQSLHECLQAKLKDKKKYLLCILNQIEYLNF